MRDRHAGVTASEVLIDCETGAMESPNVLFPHGRVPELDEHAAAELQRARSENRERMLPGGLRRRPGRKWERREGLSGRQASTRDATLAYRSESGKNKIRWASWGYAPANDLGKSYGWQPFT